MKRRTFLAITVIAATLPALAQPTCPAPQVAMGSNCTLASAVGWGIAGLGTDSVITWYVPPNASGPVDFEVTGLNSSLGSTYNGYFGIMVRDVGDTDVEIVTLADILSFGPESLAPGQVVQFLISEVCWDPTCTSPAPAGAAPNMFSMQFRVSSPNSADLGLTPNPQLVMRFLKGGRATWVTQVSAVRGNSIFSIIPGINLGATPEERYVYTGESVNLPFIGFSVANLNNPGPISGTVTLQDLDHNTIATAPIPTIPPGGAAGYLLVGREPGDSLGLFPSSTVLPADSEGVFHGILVVGLNGLVVGGVNIVAVQEYNGYSLRNLSVFRSPTP